MGFNKMTSVDQCGIRKERLEVCQEDFNDGGETEIGENKGIFNQ